MWCKGVFISILDDMCWKVKIFGSEGAGEQEVDVPMEFVGNLSLVGGHLKNYIGFCLQ